MMTAVLPRWDYWMWDDESNYIPRYAYDMVDHPDRDFLWQTEWDERWTRQLFLKVEEAVALSFGRSPDKVPWNDDPWGVKEMEGSSEFATFFCDVRQVVVDAQESGALPTPIPALMYIQWAAAKGVPFPPALARAIENFYDVVMHRLMDHLDGGDADVAVRPDKANKRKENNLLRLVLAVAMDKYRHPAPGAAKRIADAIDRQGGSLDEETIRKYLKEAETLPDAPSGSGG